MNSQAIASLTLELQKSLDSNYDVIDMQTVLFVIQQLEGATITKEQLETTRLAKYINQLRRRTVSESLARRAKNLLKTWRDMVMPALQQSGTTAAAAATTTTTGFQQQQGLPPTTSIGSVHNQHHLHQSHSQQQPSISSSAFLSSTTATTTSSQQQQPIVANSNYSTNSSSSTTKLLTGSANNNNNNNNTSSKTNSLSNGGHHHLSYSGMHRNTAATSVVGGSVQTSVPIDLSQQAVVTKTISLPPSSSDSQLHQQQQQQQQHQPTSFANLITSQSQSQSQPPTLFSSSSSSGIDPNIDIAGPSSSSPFIDIARINETPMSAALPQITRMMQQRQSPISLLDFDSNPSRSCAVSPIIQQTVNNSTPKKKPLVNGDGVIGAPPVAYEFHDSNSTTSTMDTVSGGGGGGSEGGGIGSHTTTVLLAALRQSPQIQPDLLKCYSMPPSATIAEGYSSSSNHRKSKKHKKDKKRNKQSPDKPSSLQQQHHELQSFVPQASSASILQQFVQEIPAASDETMTTIPGTGTVVFPPHDNSLSSSSMSLFPSTSTNTMLIQNSSRMASTSYASADNLPPNESELTFAGKFTNSSTGIPSIGSSGNNSSFDTVLSTSLTSTAKKSTHPDKDDDLIVVIESRSCSPFTTTQMGPDDSCTSSSRTTIPDIVSVIHQDGSNQGGESKILQTVIEEQLMPIVKEDLAPVLPIVVEPVVTAPVPKKRGRKKGSRGVDAVIAQTHAFLHSSMFERPRLLFTGSKKVKTTKELLADIQSRNLGSSATSSPTLALPNRPSASPPSTCSEASLQSDITNTRASVNQRSSPELNTILANSRQSDIDDINSATDSNDTSGLVKQATDIKIAAEPKQKTVEDYLNDLEKLLPAIDYTKLQWNLVVDSEETIICTCTVRQVETVVMPPEEEVTIVDEVDVEPPSTIIAQAIIEKVKPSIEAMATISVPANIVPPMKKSPKKPVKSIFDLDYDDDNDPLHSFVEAAKLRGNNSTTEIFDDTKTNLDNIQQDNTNSHDEIPVAVNNINKSDSVVLEKSMITATISSSNSLEPATNLTAISIPIQKQSTISSVINSVEKLNSEMLQNIPQYEIIEDENCLAKYRFDVQTNCITEYHVNALHNFYIPNVNGNWNAPISMTADHRKKLRHRNIGSKKRRRRSNSNSSSHSLNSSSDELYNRVVPQYDHIILDKVLKDLSHVKFTKNYLKKKRKREREAAASILADKVAAAAAAASNSENISRSSTSKKRKRKQSSSKMDTEGKNDASVMHKHQRRRKRKKLPHNKLDSSGCIDISLSSINKEKNSVDVEVSDDTVILDDKPNTFGDTDNACDVDASKSLIGSQLYCVKIEHEPIVGSYHLSIKIDRDDIDDDYRHSLSRDDNESHGFDKDDDQSVQETENVVQCKENITDITFIESSSNSSNSCNSNFKKNNLDNQLSTSTTILIDDDDDVDVSSNSNQYREYQPDDDYNDDENDTLHVHNDNTDVHEVVTHDMTSSTSTTSQQHIVLTIKKKILKSSDEIESSSPILQLPQIIASRSPQNQSAILTSSSSLSSPPPLFQSASTPSPSPPPIPALSNSGRNNCEQILQSNIISNDDDNVKMIDIFDNNNVKIDVSSLAVSSDDNIVRSSSSSTAENLITTPDTLKSSPNSNLPKGYQQQQQLNVSVIIDNYKNSSPINLNSNNTKISDMNLKITDEIDDNINSNDNRINLLSSAHSIDSKLRDLNEIDIKQPLNEKQDITENCLGMQSSELIIPVNFENLIKSENISITTEILQDDHNSINNDTLCESEELSFDNNKLLKTFNNLTETNFTGLHLVGNDNNNGNSDNDENKIKIAASTTKTNAYPDEQVQEFREWHEVLQVRSYNDELLTILPYVVID